MKKSVIVITGLAMLGFIGFSKPAAAANQTFKNDYYQYSYPTSWKESGAGSARYLTELAPKVLTQKLQKANASYKIRFSQPYRGKTLKSWSTFVHQYLQEQYPKAISWEIKPYTLGKYTASVLTVTTKVMIPIGGHESTKLMDSGRRRDITDVIVTKDMKRVFSIAGTLEYSKNMPVSNPYGDIYQTIVQSFKILKQ